MSATALLSTKKLRSLTRYVPFGIWFLLTKNGNPNLGQQRQPFFFVLLCFCLFLMFLPSKGSDDHACEVQQEEKTVQTIHTVTYNQSVTSLPNKMEELTTLQREYRECSLENFTERCWELEIMPDSHTGQFSTAESGQDSGEQ